MANLEIMKRDGADPRHFTWSRRNFTSLSGWGLVLGSLVTGVIAFARLLYPRVLFEPPTVARVGRPEEYLPGTVSERWIERHRLWIVRTNDRIFAVSGICTHLGCTPRWLEAEDKWKCPCHGSGFRGLGAGASDAVAGVNFEGPAPRPLERYKIGIAEDGQIVVDKSQVFRGEQGQWDSPEASIRIAG